MISKEKIGLELKTMMMMIMTSDFRQIELHKHKCRQDFCIQHTVSSMLGCAFSLKAINTARFSLYNEITRGKEKERRKRKRIHDSMKDKTNRSMP